MICCPAKGCIKMPLGKCTGGAVIDLFLFHFPFFCTRSLYVFYKYTYYYVHKIHTVYTCCEEKNSSIPFGGASRCHVTLAIDIFLFRHSPKYPLHMQQRLRNPRKVFCM